MTTTGLGCGHQNPRWRFLAGN